MCWIRYCGTCLAAAGLPELVEYAEGRIHIQPTIADPNLAWAVQYRRREILDDMIRIDICAAVKFPELSAIEQQGSVRHASIGRLAKLYDVALGQNSAFAEFAVSQGMTNVVGGGDRRSRAQRRAQLRRQAAIVTQWIRDHVDDLEALRGFLDPTVPACMDEVAMHRLKHPAPSADDQLPLAA